MKLLPNLLRNKKIIKRFRYKATKPSEPEDDKTLPSYIENCTKAIELVLKKFDQSKEERDFELEKLKLKLKAKLKL